VNPKPEQAGLDVNDVMRKEAMVAKESRTEANVKKVQDGKPLTNRDRGAAPTPPSEEPRVLGEICVEELAIDGICGVY
jgi:mycofactocin precursor